MQTAQPCCQRTGRSSGTGTSAPTTWRFWPESPSTGPVGGPAGANKIQGQVGVPLASGAGGPRQRVGARGIRTGPVLGGVGNAAGPVQTRGLDRGGERVPVPAAGPRVSAAAGGRALSGGERRSPSRKDHSPGKIRESGRLSDGPEGEGAYGRRQR